MSDLRAADGRSTPAAATGLVMSGFSRVVHTAHAYAYAGVDAVPHGGRVHRGARGGWGRGVGAGLRGWGPVLVWPLPLVRLHRWGHRSAVCVVVVGGSTCHVWPDDFTHTPHGGSPRTPCAVRPVPCTPVPCAAPHCPYHASACFYTHTLAHTSARFVFPNPRNPLTSLYDQS